MAINKPQSVWHSLIRIALLYFPCWIIGSLTDSLSLITIVFCIAIIVFHYLQIIKLNKWLWTERGRYPPRGIGIWSNIFDGIYGQQRRFASKRTDLANIIRQFRKGAEALPDGVVIFDNQRHIFWCNKIAQDMLGLKWPEDQGVRIDNLIRTPDFIAYLNNVNFDKPLELVSPLNDHYILEIRIAPFESDKWVIIVRDITHLYEIEQMRKDFIANVSHELKTPLTVMKGYLEMTESLQNLDEKTWQQAHKMMYQQTNRMDALVSQLLSLSKMEQKSNPVEKMTTDLSELLTILSNEAKSLSAGKHEIIANIQPGLKTSINESELRSACVNLISNAVRYTPEGGTIKIEWQQLDRQTGRFSVSDNGVGIDANHIPRLTERFYRVDEARTSNTGGAGIGLSIVKHALAHHNSYLKIESTPNKGSRFFFDLKLENN